MTETAEILMRAVIADPGDDTVRLAYADYLEEEGNAQDAERATFIRAQIELYKIGPPRVEVASVLRSHGPDYWSLYTSENDTGDTPLKVGDRIDVIEEFRIGDVRTPQGQRIIRDKKKRKFHGLRVMRVEVDDPSLGTMTVTVKRDEYSIPYPDAKVKELMETAIRLIDKREFREFGNNYPHTLILGCTTNGTPSGPSIMTHAGAALWTFERGFISRVRIGGQLRDIYRLFRAFPITEVELQYHPTMYITPGSPRCLRLSGFPDDSNCQIPMCLLPRPMTLNSLRIALLKTLAPQIPQWTLPNTLGEHAFDDFDDTLTEPWNA